MNSINDRRIQRFFHKRLVPAARRLRERGVEFFPMGPDDAESWYQTVPEEEEEVFEFDAEQTAQVLEELWSTQELPELVELAEPLMKLARQLEQTEKESGDVDPFVYVMY